MSSISRNVSATPSRLSVIFLSLMLGSVLLLNGLVGMEPSKARKERVKVQAKYKKEQAKAEATWIMDAGNARAKAMEERAKVFLK